MYKILDLQTGGYFRGGHKFKNKEEIIDALASYHDIDFTGTDLNDNELSIKEYLYYWGMDTIQKQLKWLLDYGDWEIKKVKK